MKYQALKIFLLSSATILLDALMVNKRCISIFSYTSCLIDETSLRI